MESKLEMAQIYLGLANTYMKQGKSKWSINYFEQAKILAEELESNNELKNAFEGLAQINANLGDYQNAYTYQTRLNEIERS